MAERYDAGIVTAYGAAVRGGYTGTYDEFCAQQANYAQTAAAVEQAKTDAQAAAQRAQDVADSIPEDYTELTEEVGDLKDDLDDVETALETKAEIDGYYEEMTVGNAEQLVSTVTNADDTPYNFRTTAGSADMGDRAYVDAIVGGTLSVNQLAPILSSEKWAGNSQFGTCVFDGNKATYTITQKSGSQSVYISNVKGGIPLIKDHKYVVEFDATISQSTSSLSVNVMDTQWVSCPSVQANTKQHCAKVFNSANATGGNAYFGIYPSTGAGVDIGGTFVLENVVVIDLTAMFGSTIADYVYGLETATAGAGVAWLKANFPKIFDGGYIPFNAGTLQSVVGLSEKRNTGLNQWDEEVELGTISNENGANIDDNGKFRSKNYIRLASGRDYYFEHKTSDVIGVRYYDSSKNFIGTYAITTAEGSLLHRGTASLPNNAMYMRFVNISTNVYNHDICINLHWDGEKDGTYEPYTVHTYAFDPTVELRGMPKLKDGKMYFDGDRYLPDGTVNRRYILTNLGAQNWGSGTLGNVSFFTTDLGILKHVEYGQYANAICSKYVTSKTESGGVRAETFVDKSFIVWTNGAIYVKDSAYSDVESFKAGLSGVYLVAELATPTTETAEPYQHVQICDDFGTEEFISTSPVPVGHNTRYAPNLRAKLEMSPDSPDGDGLYIVQQSGGENTYIPLASSSTIQNILERLTALEGNTNEG